MSDLQRIIEEARRGLAPYEGIPERRWAEVAARCGPAEATEIRARIEALRAELETVPAWDGDTWDDVQRAIRFFEQLLALASRPR